MIGIQELRKRLVTNWPIKLTALALAAVLWAAVAAQEPTTQLVSVDLVVEPPPGRTLTRALPPVRALYSGTARELIKLYAAPPIVRRAIPDTVSDSLFRLSLSIGDLEPVQNADVTAQDIQPRSIVLQLDDVVRRTVPVVARASIRPDSGFALFGGIAIVPSSLEVMGPVAQVARVRELLTLPIELRRVSGPVHRAVEIDTAGLGNVRLSQRDVEISAEVGPISERVLMGIPVAVGDDQGNAWEPEPPAVIVTVRGPTARLLRMTRDSVAVAALPQSEGEADTVRLEVIAPPGIEGTATPDSAVLQRRSSD